MDGSAPSSLPVKRKAPWGDTDLRDTLHLCEGLPAGWRGNGRDSRTKRDVLCRREGIASLLCAELQRCALIRTSPLRQLGAGSVQHPQGSCLC